MKIYQSIFAVTLIFAASLANAASWLECNGDSWRKIKFKGNSTTVNISSNSYPPAWQSKIEDAVKIVNHNPSPFWINTVVENDGVGNANGENEVYYADIEPAGVAISSFHCYWWKDTFLGITYDSGYKWGLDEVDVILDSHDDDGTPHPWTIFNNKSLINKYGGSNAMAEAVFVHEFGHLLGLQHVNAEYNIMGDAWHHMIAQNGKTHSYFGEDASKGATQLYGTQNSWYRDLSVSHYRYTGVSGEYSTHARTRVFKKHGTKWQEVTPYTSSSYGGVNNQPVNERLWGVSRGDRIRFEFTVENNGKQTETNVRCGTYISTNDFISTSDRQIHTYTWDAIAAQGAAYTFFSEITIPNDLDQNRVYWVGYIVDDNNQIHEKTGKNNAAYIPVWIE